MNVNRQAMGVREARIFNKVEVQIDVVVDDVMMEKKNVGERQKFRSIYRNIECYISPYRMTVFKAC